MRRSAPRTRRNLCWKIDLSVTPPAERIFGAMLAGGESCRFGGPKVLAPLSGAPMASWGLSVLEAAGLTVGVISDEEGVEAALALPARPDRRGSA